MQIGFIKQILKWPADIPELTFKKFKPSFETLVYILWQYRLWSFQTRGIKLERFLPKNQHTQRKLLYFVN